MIFTGGVVSALEPYSGNFDFEGGGSRDSLLSGNEGNSLWLYSLFT